MRDSPLARATFKEVEFVGGSIRVAGDFESALPLLHVMAMANENRIEEKYLLLPNLLKQKKYVRATHSAVFC